MAGKKITADLSEDSWNILETIKQESGIPYGNTINTVLQSFGRMPSTTKAELLKFCKDRLKQLYEKVDTASGYALQELTYQIESYNNIITFLNNGIRVSLDSIRSEITMRKIRLHKGTLICPNDWIILNPEAAAHSEYCCVVECDTAKADLPTQPHYLFFNNYRYNTEYPESMETHIKEEILKINPEFTKVLARIVDPICDPDDPKHNVLNAEAVYHSANIGFYSIYVYGDKKRYPTGYTPPYGAQIMRDNDEE